MKIETKEEFHIYGNGTDARLSLSVFVDGMPCGSVTVASGPIRDIEDLRDGKVSLPDLALRFQNDRFRAVTSGH